MQALHGLGDGFIADDVHLQRRDASGHLGAGIAAGAENAKPSCSEMGGDGPAEAGRSAGNQDDAAHDGGPGWTANKRGAAGS